MPEFVAATGYEDAARGIDWILARLHYPGVSEVAVSGGWHHPKAFPFSADYSIVCDGGTLEYSTKEGPLKLYTESGAEETVPVTDVDGYQAEIEYFFQCASQGRQPEMCPPEESAAAVKLTRLMVASRSRNGEPIACRS